MNYLIENGAVFREEVFETYSNKSFVGNSYYMATIRIDTNTVTDVSYTFDLELGEYVETGRVTRYEPDPNVKSPLELKLAELNTACNAAILAGFTSSALGTPHTYDFDEEAQGNLSGRLSLINANPSYPDSFLWKTKDQGPLSHSKVQFIQLCMDADTFKNDMIGHYWTLKGQVIAAQTPEQLAAIVW